MYYLYGIKQVPHTNLLSVGYESCLGPNLVRAMSACDPWQFRSVYELARPDSEVSAVLLANQERASETALVL
jgi:hypothetical protein